MNQYQLERSADQILAAAPKSSEYPVLTRDRIRRIAQHEVSVSDVDIAKFVISKDEQIDKLKIRERDYQRARVAV